MDRELELRGAVRAVIALIAAAVVVALGLAAPAPAAAATEWLCHPGSVPNPCHESQETTVEQPDGTSRVDNVPLPADPPVDCFYVYPTVSDQPTTNATKARDTPVVAIARYQAARFSQTCRVYAPLYRQLTVLSIFTGTPEQRSAGFKVAYADVLEAWRDYLAHHNQGRGVVLIGHSQGTRMLRQLLHDEIDPKPEERRRLVSAVLLGGNVLVRKGELAGGDAQHLPACTAPDQTGCLIAFQSYGEDPPDDTRFGKSPTTDPGAGLPFGPDYEVLCNNPASLDANQRLPLTTYLRSEPFPGLVGAAMIGMFGGLPPSAPTPWLQPRDRYTGRCETRNGANVFLIEPIGDARRLNASPQPNWGLHLADANIALGELVSVVERQAATYLRPDAGTAGGPPRLALRLSFTRGRDARGRTCARSGLRVVVAGRDRRAVRRADLRLRGRTVTRDRRAPFAVSVRRARLRRAVVNRVQVVAALQDGRRVTLTRSVRAC